MCQGFGVGKAGMSEEQKGRQRGRGREKGRWRKRGRWCDFLPAEGTKHCPPGLPQPRPCTLTPSRLALTCPQCPPHTHSRALNELLQLLDLAAQLLGRREALAHLHEERRDLVASQEAGRPPPQPMQHAGLHGRWGDTVVASCPVSCVQSPAPRATTVQRNRTRASLSGAPKESREVGG